MGIMLVLLTLLTHIMISFATKCFMATRHNHAMVNWQQLNNYIVMPIDCVMLDLLLLICLKMLDLYLLGQNCLHLTFKPNLSSETYSRKYEKLPNIVVHARKILQKKCICWKCRARKFSFVCLRFDPLRRNS